MDNIVTDFNRLYPAFAANRLNGCNLVIHEHENRDKPNTLQTVTVTDLTGWEFSRNFLENAKSFHSQAQKSPLAGMECHEIMVKECDGLFCREENGQIVFHFFELKSSFDVDNLAKAKDQITGSYLKLLHLLAPLQQFEQKKTNITMKGHIFIYEPDTEKLSTIKTLSDRKARFCFRIHSDKSYFMPSGRCSSYWAPLWCPDIALDLTELPYGTASHQISL